MADTKISEPYTPSIPLKNNFTWNPNTPIGFISTKIKTYGMQFVRKHVPGRKISFLLYY